MQTWIYQGGNEIMEARWPIKGREIAIKCWSAWPDRRLPPVSRALIRVKLPGSTHFNLRSHTLYLIQHLSTSTLYITKHMSDEPRSGKISNKCVKWYQDCNTITTTFYTAPNHTCVHHNIISGALIRLKLARISLRQSSNAVIIAVLGWATIAQIEVIWPTPCKKRWHGRRGGSREHCF